jgi:hypothetical protein
VLGVDQAGLGRQPRTKVLTSASEIAAACHQLSFRRSKSAGRTNGIVLREQGWWVQPR